MRSLIDISGSVRGGTAPILFLRQPEDACAHAPALLGFSSGSVRAGSLQVASDYQFLLGTVSIGMGPSGMPRNCF